jgi:hypothetical protein
VTPADQSAQVAVHDDHGTREAIVRLQPVE